METALQQRLKSTLEEIRKAAEACGRDPKDVTLVAVSKTKPVELIQEAYDMGYRVFGENKVQELTAKYEIMPKDIEWHLIGHLQTNKVKYIVDKVAMIHSVDSVKLAKMIDKEARKKNVDHVDVLLEINVSGEESKFGMTPDELLSQIDEFLELENVRIRGLMTVAPFTEDPETCRPYFRRLRQLSVDIQKKISDNDMDISLLSMGMSGDFKVAIEEGASFVRIGTQIFGERNYNI